jgi:hypothetical protein
MKHLQLVNIKLGVGLKKLVQYLGTQVNLINYIVIKKHG